MSAAVRALPAQLAALAEMDRPALLALWRKTHGSPPPKNLSAVFLRRALAYEVQSAALGGPSRKVWKQLNNAPTKTAATRPLAPSLPPGARLVREWHGCSYHVEVTVDGFVMDGRSWASLSAIARHITGSHWSGPRFFGLTRAQGDRSGHRSGGAS